MTDSNGNSNGNGQHSLDPQGVKEFGAAYKAAIEHWKQTYRLDMRSRPKSITIYQHWNYQDGKDVPPVPLLRKIISDIRLSDNQARPLKDAVFKAHKLGEYETPDEVIENRFHIHDQGTLLQRLLTANLMESPELAAKIGRPARLVGQYRNNQKDYNEDAEKIAQALLPGAKRADARENFLDRVYHLHRELVAAKSVHKEPQKIAPKPAHHSFRDEEKIQQLFSELANNPDAFASFGALAKEVATINGRTTNALRARYGASKQALQNLQSDDYIPSRLVVKRWGEAYLLSPDQIELAAQLAERKAAQRLNGHAQPAVSTDFADMFKKYLLCNNIKPLDVLRNIRRFHRGTDLTVPLLKDISDGNSTATERMKEEIVKGLGFTDHHGHANFDGFYAAALLIGNGQGVSR